MSVIISTRGTIHTSFTIGRTGLVLTQTGTAELPDGEDFTVSTSASRGLRVNAEGGTASITTDNSILDITASDLRFNGVNWPNLADGAGKVLTTDGVGGIIWAEYVNSANSASKLSNPRAITLTGDVTGVVTFDGTADVMMATSLAKSVALGIETTGNFVSGLSAGTGITITGTPAAGWVPVIINSAPNVTTDISVTHNETNVVVQSSDGADGIINAATASLAGVMTAADKGKLDGIDAVISASTAVNIHAAAAKTTLADADEFGIADSATSWELKKVTWANIKSSVSGNFYPNTGGDLSGDINITGTGRRITGDFSNSDPASRLLFSTNVPNSASYVGVIPNGGYSYSAIHAYNSSNPSNSSTLAVIASSSTVSLASYAVGEGALLPLTIDIDYVERARYTTSGGYSVGTTADPGAGSIYATGNITAHFSDERLKTVSGKISNALGKVKQLTGVYYTNNAVAKANGYTSDKTQVGVLAGEVEQVLPEVVVPAPFDLDEHGHSKSGEHYRTVQYDKLVPLLIEAIKELSDIVDSFKR